MNEQLEQNHLLSSDPQPSVPQVSKGHLSARGRTHGDAAIELILLIGGYALLLVIIVGLGYLYVEERRNHADTLEQLIQQLQEGNPSVSAESSEEAMTLSKKSSELRVEIAELEHDLSVTKDEKEESHSDIAAASKHLESLKNQISIGESRYEQLTQQEVHAEARQEKLLSSTPQLLAAGDSFINSARQISAEQNKVDPDFALVEDLLRDQQNKIAAFETIAEDIREESLFGVFEILTSVATHNGWGVSNGDVSALVGLPKDKLIDMLQTNDGLGYDLWGNTYSGPSSRGLLGLVVKPPMLIRVVNLELANGHEGDYVSNAEVIELLPPFVGPSIHDAWEHVSYNTVISKGGANVIPAPLANYHGSAATSLGEFYFFGDGMEFGKILYERTDQPVLELSVQGLKQLLDSGDLPKEAESDLRFSTGIPNLKVILSMKKNLRHSDEANFEEAPWDDEIAVIANKSLKNRLNRIFAYGMVGARDPNKGHVPEDFALGFESGLPEAFDTTSPGLDAGDLGTVTAMTLQDDFKLDVAYGKSCSETKPAHTDASLKKHCVKQATVTISGSTEQVYEIVFEHRALNGGWIIARKGHLH